MKIRINGNSLRFRLTPNEVETLVNIGNVQDQCVFPQGELSYGIKASQAETIDVNFQGNTIQVYLPESELLNWHIDERVGFQYELNGLSLLVEKDFKCLKPRINEEESHLYPNPNEAK